MRLPYIKLGSIPFGPALVRSKKNMPKVGEIVYIRHDNKKTTYVNPWIRVKIDLIKHDVCVFVHGVSKYEM